MAQTTEAVDRPVNGEDNVETTNAPQAPGLDLNDLAQALHLINVAIKRGAYDRTELRNVLDVTDKLDAFLQYQANAQAMAQKINEKGEA